MRVLKSDLLKKEAYQQLLEHNPIISNNWVKLEESVLKETSLEPNLLKKVHQTLHFKINNNRCDLKMRSKGISTLGVREKMATRFAKQFIESHTAIDSIHFKVLKEEFNKQEIAELCSFIFLVTATQKLEKVLDMTSSFNCIKIKNMDYREVQFSSFL